MKKKYCRDCGNVLPPHYIGWLCHDCNEKTLEGCVGTSPYHYEVGDMMVLLGIDSEEQVRRLSKKGKIPCRVPGVTRHRFFRACIDEWLRQYQVAPKTPTSPLQKEAWERCHNNDHDWLAEDRFDGIAYSSEEAATEISQHVISTGYNRTCCSCKKTFFIPNS